MNLTPAERDRLAIEGLDVVEMLADFKEEELKMAVKNMREPIPGDPNAQPPVAPIPAVHLSALCFQRLKIASNAFHYYEDIGRDITARNMNYTNVLKGFHTEWEAIQKLLDEDKPSIPLLNPKKGMTPLRWLESFKDCLFHTYGVRGCPLSYVTRENAQVPTETDDPLVLNTSVNPHVLLPYGSSGSVLDEMIKRLTHNHPLFKTDNNTVFSMLEEATRGTVFATTVKSFARTKDGRAAWLAMLSSHCGKDKWESLQKERMDFLMNTKWNGRVYSLDKFCGAHRSAYVQLQEASSHVPFQLPTEHTRVGYLIDNINNNDPDLRAAIASIRLNTDNMRSDFEAAVACLLPVCPYTKSKSTSKKSISPQVSDVTLRHGSQSKTGVEFRWYTKQEYSKLSKEQRNELYQWQQSKDGKEKIKRSKEERQKKTQGDSPNKRLKSQISSMEKKLKKVAFRLDELGEESVVSEIASAISENVQASAGKAVASAPHKPTSTNDFTAAAVAVQKILKRKRDEAEDSE